MGESAIDTSIFKIQTEDRTIDWNIYYSNVVSDFKELKAHYPIAYLTIPPTVKPELAMIRVIAANKSFIELVRGVEEDYLGDYSRELHLIIPIEYREQGCRVYGAKWVKADQLKNEDIHLFYDDGGTGACHREQFVNKCSAGILE